MYIKYINQQHTQRKYKCQSISISSRICPVSGSMTNFGTGTSAAAAAAGSSIFIFFFGGVAILVSGFFLVGLDVIFFGEDPSSHCSGTSRRSPNSLCSRPSDSGRCLLLKVNVNDARSLKSCSRNLFQFL